MKGILWYVTQKLEGIFDGILMEFRMRILEDKNQIKILMYIPWFLSSSLYGRLLLLLPLNYTGSPGSSLSVVHLFFLNAKLRRK